jgi:hypothetical protein
MQMAANMQNTVEYFSSSCMTGVQREEAQAVQAAELNVEE